jgi:hypothetical protein
MFKLEAFLCQLVLMSIELKLSLGRLWQFKKLVLPLVVLPFSLLSLKLELLFPAWWLIRNQCWQQMDLQ